MTRSLLNIGVLLLVAMQVIVLAVVLRDGQTAAGPPDLPVTPATTLVEALTIETALPLADPVAREWDHEAVLVAASMEVVWPQGEEVVMPSTIADDGALTLVFAADDNQLSLLMDRRSGVIFHAEEGAWSEALASPLPVSTIVRSSSIAVLAAEVSYGTSYRAACPEYRFVTRVYLSRAAGNTVDPVWLVSYVDQRHRDQPDIQLTVDAVTGKTVGVATAALGCSVD